jgi:hypothetical protein
LLTGTAFTSLTSVIAAAWLLRALQLNINAGFLIEAWDSVESEASIWLQASQAGFPMSSPASGLAEAEKQIVKGLARVTARHGPGVYKVLVEGWEFIIDTNQKPWRVFHAVITTH